MAQAKAYNLGCGGDGYSVRQVIDTAARITGLPIPTRVVERRPGDPPVLVASSKRIEADLGWRPRHRELADIIASAWRWMNANANVARAQASRKPS
jgi:UDP-glucose 4-epimerase